MEVNSCDGLTGQLSEFQGGLSPLLGIMSVSRSSFVDASCFCVYYARKPRP